MHVFTLLRPLRPKLCVCPWLIRTLRRFVDGVPLAAAYPRCAAAGGWFSDAPAASGNCAAPFDQPFHLLVGPGPGL